MDKRVWVIQGIIGRKDKVDPLRRHAADRIADQRLSRLERSPEVRPSPPSDNREAADPFGRTWSSNRKEVGRWRPVGNAQYVVAIITSGIGGIRPIVRPATGSKKSFIRAGWRAD